MATVTQLIAQVANARKAFIAEASAFSESSAAWKPSAEKWCATEIVEHLFWAEQGGILAMWKALHAYRQGKSIGDRDCPHRGLSIEEIITKTWKEKENVPAIAAPRLGGPIAYWIISLNDLQDNLDGLARELTDSDLEIMTPPHPISGPLNIRQRLEFLRFHLGRHQKQAEELRAHVAFQNGPSISKQ